MKLLLDANLSPRIAEPLRGAGHDVAHVADLGLLTANDEEIFSYAADGAWVVITADTDFSMLLALRSAGRPSVVLLRHVAELGWETHADLLAANLATVSADLDTGASCPSAPPGCLSVVCR